MEDAGPPQQHQPLMTKLPAGLTPSHGTTLIHRSGHCYQLHRPHLALPPQEPPPPAPPQQAQRHPHKKFRSSTDTADTPTNLEPAALAAAAALANNVRQQQQQQLQQHQHSYSHQQQYSPHSQHSQQQQHQHQQQQHQQQQQQQHVSSQQQTHEHHLLVDGISRLQAQRPRNLRQQQAQPASTHISHLYPEILALIFSKLDVRDRGRAAQVCSTWREAAYHRSAWRGVEARLHLGKHSFAVFQCLQKRGIKRVQILSLTMKRELSDVLRNVPKLESLNLSGCYNMTDSGLSCALTQAYPSLTELNLSLCKNISDLGLRRIAQCLSNLETLELGGCGKISNAALKIIAWGLKKLKRLDLRSCWHISDPGIAYLAGLNQADAPGTLELEHLGLQDCQRLSDEGLRHLSVGLGNSLKSINLSFCVLITDAGMKHIAKINSLRELDLRSCDTITEIGMAYLAEGGSRISSLDVSFCDKIGDQALQHISQGLFNLKSLSMSACPITDEGIDKIAKTQQDLETLHVGQCSRLTDKSVYTIIESMPHLRCIDLYGCTRISKFGIQKIGSLSITLNLGLWQERR